MSPQAELHVEPMAFAADARASNVVQRSLGEPAPAGKSRGRFLQRSGLKMAGTGIRAASLISARLAGRLAFRLLTTPPAARTGRRDTAILASEQPIDIPFREGALKARRWGHRGPVILLVHGWGSRLTQWDRFVDPLVASGFRVVAFDAPAHGESSGLQTDMLEYAHAVARVAHAVGPVHAVVAHSFGVAASLLARRFHGLKPDRMVLISGFTHCEWILDAFRELLGFSERLLPHLRRQLDRRCGHAVDWNELSLETIVGELDARLLLVHDRDDVDIPIEHSRRLLAAAASGEMLMTEGLGHCRILRSLDVVGRVVQFLGD